MRRALLLVALVGLSACAGRAKNLPASTKAAEKVLELTHELEEALSSDESSKRDFSEVSRLYAKELAPTLQQGLASDCGPACAEAVLRALDEVCSYDARRVSPEPTAPMLAAYRRLKDAGAATIRQAGKTLDCLVKYRHYDQAAEFAPPEGLLFPPIPEGAAVVPALGVRRLIEPGMPSKIAVASPPRTGVLLLASPTCPACVTALEELEEDAGLSAALADKLLAVVRPSGADRSEAFAQANEGRRFLQREVFAAEEWPEIGNWEDEPAFVFLKNGAVVERWTGWGPDGLARFKQSLAALGLR